MINIYTEEETTPTICCRYEFVEGQNNLVPKVTKETADASSELVPNHVNLKWILYNLTSKGMVKLQELWAESRQDVCFKILFKRA